MPEQRVAADFIIKKIRHGGGAALFSQQRTGKTYISLAVIEQLKLQRVLIVAPLTPISTVWAPKLPSIMPVRDAWEPVGQFNGALLIHYQRFVKIAPQLAKRYLDTFDLVIFDESQGLKARASGQSRAARRFRDAKRRLVLSGTPIDESPIDVWGQMRFVDHTVLGERWGDFAEHFCYKGGFKNKQWIFDPKKKTELLDVLKPHIFRLNIDFLKLKPVTMILMPVRLYGNQRKIYDQMNEHSIVKINGTTITAPLAITKTVKLQQITGGHVLDEDGNAILVGKAKRGKLAYLASKLKPPLVIFCQYLHEMDDVREVVSRYFKRVAVLHGKVKDKKSGNHRTDLINNFQSGNYDVLICQLRTGGVGIELTRSSNLILYSINYSFIDFEQMIFRLRGMTQKSELKVFVIFTEETIDEEKLKAVEAKHSTVWSIVSHFEIGG